MYKENIAATGTESRRRRPAAIGSFALLGTSRLMVMIDLSIVMLALPAIRSEFRVSVASTAWAVTAYAVCFAGFLLFAGRAGDLFGKRRVVGIGYALFSIASLVGGLSATLTTFVIARAVQGIGAAFLTPNALALVIELFPDEGPRNRALGIWSAISGVAVPLGGLLGGVLVAGPGWRFVMFLNVPIGALSLALLPLLVPRSAPNPRELRLDVPGTVLVTAALILVVGVLSYGTRAGWSSAPAIASAASAAVLFALFVVVERRAASPLIRRGFFIGRSLARTYTCMALGMAGFVSSLFTLSFFLQTTARLGSIASGILLLPSAVSFTLASGIIAPRLAAKIGSRSQILVASIGMAVGFIIWARMASVNHFIALEIIGSVFVGAAGLALPVYFIEGVAKLPPLDCGLGAGLLNTAQQLGAGLGLGVTTAAGDLIPRIPDASGTLLVCAALLLLGIAVIFLPVRQKTGALAEARLQ